jgi:hypothetical protein
MLCEQEHTLSVTCGKKCTLARGLTIAHKRTNRCYPVCPSTCDAMTGAPGDSTDLCVLATVTNNYDSTYTAKWTATVAEKYQVVCVCVCVCARARTRVCECLFLVYLWLLACVCVCVYLDERTHTYTRPLW